MKKEQVFSIRSGQVEDLRQRLKQRHLLDGDWDLLDGLLIFLFRILQSAEEMRISLRRLENLWFGKKTEKSDRIGQTHRRMMTMISLQGLQLGPNQTLRFLVHPAVNTRAVLRRIVPRVTAGWEPMFTHKPRPSPAAMLTSAGVNPAHTASEALSIR